MGDNRPDFSFSGLKTAVTKHVRESGLRPMQNGEEPSQEIKDLAANALKFLPKVRSSATLKLLKTFLG